LTDLNVVEGIELSDEVYWGKMAKLKKLPGI